MIDLGQDFDVVGAVVGRRLGGLAEEFAQSPQIVRAALDRDFEHCGDRFQFAVAIAGEHGPIGGDGAGQMPGDPVGGHQGRHGDRQHFDRVAKADQGSEPLELRTSANSARRPVMKWMRSGGMRWFSRVVKTVACRQHACNPFYSNPSCGDTGPSFSGNLVANGNVAQPPLGTFLRFAHQADSNPGCL